MIRLDKCHIGWLHVLRQRKTWSVLDIRHYNAVCSTSNMSHPRRNIMKKVERFSFQGLTFPRHCVKLSVDFGSATNGERFLSSFLTFFSGKEYVSPPSFKICFFVLWEKNHMEALCFCIFVSCWTSFCSSHEQVLGRIFIPTYEAVSGFLLLGGHDLNLTSTTTANWIRLLRRALELNLPRSTNAPVRLSVSSHLRFLDGN